MASITVQELQEIAVQCTSDFFNNNISLNEGLAKQASMRGLNSDQLKRAVEATNTLTYLKSVDVAKDRTSEFPVGDYNEIVKLASIPESLLQKTASAGEVLEVETVKTSAELVKEAEQKLSPSAISFTDREKLIYLQKYAHINGKALETAQENLAFTGEKLVKLASAIKKSPQGLEHLSASSLTDDEFTKIAGLVFGQDVKRLDFVSGMFKSAALNEVESFIGLYKQAKELHSEVSYRKSAQEQLKSFEKTAFLGAAARIAGGVAKAATPTGLGKGVGMAIGGTVKGTVKTVAKVVSAPVAAAGKTLGVKAQNAAAGTSWGKELKIPTATVPKSTKRVLGATTILGGAALDAGFYTPSINPAKDKSGSVWSALNGSGT